MCTISESCAADKQEGMFNLKRIVNGSQTERATLDFYLLALH